MKKLIIILILCYSNIGLSQRDNKDINYFDVYLGMSIDPNMAINGPGYSYEDLNSTYNAEYKIGIETTHFRVGVYFETHNDIGYRKWTWLAVDYKLNNFPLKNFSSYAGLESSVIFRYEKDAQRWEGDTIAFNPGVNGEIQYNIKESPFSIGAGINVFRAEATLINDNKNVRWDGMISIYIKI